MSFMNFARFFSHPPGPMLMPAFAFHVFGEQCGSLSLSPDFYSEFTTSIREKINTGKTNGFGYRPERFSFSPMAFLNHGVKNDGRIDVHDTHNNISTVVKSIEKISYTGDVYNLAVENDESYIVNGFIVHNCRSILVPVTKFEDYKSSGEYYEPGSEPDIEDLQEKGGLLLFQKTTNDILMASGKRRAHD